MEYPNPHSYDSYCVVRRGASWYALAALAVREIVPAPTFVAIPGSAPLVAGLCHLRNEFLAVLRLDVLAGGPEPVNPEGQQLIVLTGGSGSWAVLVDEVAALEPLDVSIDPESKSPDSWTAAILGSAAHRDRVVRVLDVNSMYRLAERMLAEHLPADAQVPLAPECRHLATTFSEGQTA